MTEHSPKSCSRRPLTKMRTIKRYFKNLKIRKNTICVRMLAGGATVYKYRICRSSKKLRMMKINHPKTPISSVMTRSLNKIDTKDGKTRMI